MWSEVRKKLSQLNFEFYQTFAIEFAETRQRIQPGVERILDEIPLDASIIDLGCGNGEVARQLSRRGYRGRYLGVDASAELIDIANVRVQDPHIEFGVLDATAPDLPDFVPIQNHLRDAGRFQSAFLFAVLHHIPSADSRRQVMTSVRELLASGAICALSNWSFLESEKWKNRIVPWKEIGLREEDVEAGDYLLDWRHGGRGLRYVHYFTAQELEELSSQAGFRLIDMFYSDGEGGRLGLYQIWEAC